MSSKDNKAERPVKYLKSIGVIKEGHETFIITFKDGRQISLEGLIEDYHEHESKQLQEQNKWLREALELAKEVAEVLTDFPAGDVKSWIDYGRPVTMTIPVKTLEQALSILSNEALNPTQNKEA